jgi:2-C-methyl-D-erythritol 4-phosphate cytidylyltransferase
MVSAIIVAAGQGVRMGNSIPKQYLKLGDHPILAYSLMAFSLCSSVDKLYLVIPESDVDYCCHKIVRPLKLITDIQLVPGGSHRQFSVYNGLRKIEDRPGIVVIHDGVRPFVKPDHIQICIQGAREAGACILAVPVADTLKKVNSSNLIDGTIERKGVWQAQTPQAFAYDLITQAHEKARVDGFIASDDALLVERLGQQVKIVTGNRNNFKITTPEDLRIAQAMLAFY